MYIREITPLTWEFNPNISSHADFEGKEGNPENRDEAQLNVKDRSEKVAKKVLMNKCSKHFRSFFSHKANVESVKEGVITYKREPW